ncbi:MAG: DUF4124 domain-containing protein [Pseudomonadales bacterium]|nr:DUF4124 domain-containing protein [Pseudomonadales bacterium]
MQSRLARFSIPLLLALFAYGATTSAEIYRWVDEDGKVHFTDQKPAAGNAESVELEIPDVGEPDEGELRRRELLKNAEEDFANDRRRAEERAADEHQRRVERPTGYAANRMCDEARIRYGVLHETMPIYWTTDDELRPAWSNDTYQGSRTYVADAERPNLIETVQENMNRNCANPGDMRLQQMTYAYWEHSNWCAAFKVKISTAHLARSKTPRSTIESMEEEYARDC